MDVGSMLARMIDYFKVQKITSFMTNLTSDTSRLEETEVGISSMVDTWILLRMVEEGGARCRKLAILKSRGMCHSNRIQPFNLNGQGFQLLGLEKYEPEVQDAEDRARC